MAEKYPSSSSDQDALASQNDFRLCPLDQQNPGSCSPLSCYNFHMCRDYLLTNKCSEFESTGKCSHSHSLFTRHNQRILEKKFNLSAKDRGTFDRISQHIQTSEKESNASRRSAILHDDESTGKQGSVMYRNQGRSGVVSSSSPPPPSFSKRLSSDNQSSTNEKKLAVSTRPLLLTNSDFSRSTVSKSMDFSVNPEHHITTRRSLDLLADQSDQQENDKRNPNTGHSSSVFKPKEKNDYPSSLDDADENNHTSSIVTAAYRAGKSIKATVSDFFSKTKEKNPIKPDPNDSARNDTKIKYVFNKYLKDDQLSYLLGPVRRSLVDRKGYQIFPSGYCRLENPNQEKEIEQRLQIGLPMRLKIDRIQLLNDDFAFLISTSAAERIFEQNQLTYSIISESYTTSVLIEVRRAPRDDPTRPLRTFSTRLSTARETPQLPISDGKFLIPQMNSSINVIRGDITEVKVDLMVCVSSSQTLLNSVLSKAGPSIRSQYYQESRSQNPILLDGGSTSAQKILFVIWEWTVDPSNTRRAQTSLSDLVKQCIQRASQSNMRSIAFPSIGTGKIGLNPNKVCETMVNAASDCLHKYKMDVLFVIYPSSGSEQQSYQVFRSYLDEFCKQNRSIRAATPPIHHVPQSSTIPVERSEQIRRPVECKRISSVSNSSDMTFDHSQLVKALERLIEEKRFDLNLVQQPFIDQVDLLIDVCLDYHVLPCIDFAKGDLILRGDRESCSQCFANLRNQRLIHRYSMFNKTGMKSGEINLNMYVSMKIDEAFTNNESIIRIEDDDETVFHIDLKASEIHINDDVQAFDLYRRQLNADSKILFPELWSPLSIIQTVKQLPSSYDSMDCVRLFEKTMPTTEWNILRIDTIQNWPLYVHYTTNSTKNKDDISVFHGCSFSSVQSIIHYGLHSNYVRQPENSIRLTRDALTSHIWNARRSTDGKYYMFVVRLSKKYYNQDSFNLLNQNAEIALPVYLIVYRRETVV